MDLHVILVVDNSPGPGGPRRGKTKEEDRSISRVLGPVRKDSVEEVILGYGKDNPQIEFIVMPVLFSARVSRKGKEPNLDRRYI